MTTLAHPVSPKEVMALIDGELSEPDAIAVSEHLHDCAECSSIAAQFRSTSQMLASWTVPAAPATLEDFVSKMAAVQTMASAQTTRRDTSSTRPPARSFRWKPWMSVASGMAAVALPVVAVVVFAFTPRHETSHMTRSPERVPSFEQDSSEALQTATLGSSLNASRRLQSDRSGYLVSSVPSNPDTMDALRAPAPMVARTATLAMTIKDFDAARRSLETIVSLHRGYVANMNTYDHDGQPRDLRASLRVPSQDLAATLAEIKALGHVDEESQAGEEVTEQHADLEDRLKTARDTEERFRSILTQHTGSISDVLKVQREIASVRSDIERMEADEKEMDHRVRFATIDLHWGQVYQFPAAPAAPSVAHTLGVAIEAGWRNAGETAMTIAQIIATEGPALLVWLSLPGLVTFLLWRRHKRKRNQR